MNRTTEQCIEWIRRWFKSNGGKIAVVGISGGKDSTVVAKLCCEALGKDNVVGVLMPNGEQKDIADSFRVCETLGIHPDVVDISRAYLETLRYVEFFHGDGTRIIPTERTRVNLAPRLRMAVLYAIAQSLDCGRVACTGNFDELLMGYFTLWGDGAGDFAPLAAMHVSQVIATGRDLGVPEELLVKPPADGLTGRTDEENLGFSYADVESMWRKVQADVWSTDCDLSLLAFTEKEKLAHERWQAMAWKANLTHEIPAFDPSDSEG